MQKVLITTALALVLNLPDTALAQVAESRVHRGDSIALRIGGAVRSGGLFNVDPTATISGALALAGGPTLQSKGDEVLVFRNGKIITTVLGGKTLIANSPIQSGDQLFVAWQSSVPTRSWISRNIGPVGMFVAATVGIVVAFSIY